MAACDGSRCGTTRAARPWFRPSTRQNTDRDVRLLRAHRLQHADRDCFAWAHEQTLRAERQASCAVPRGVSACYPSQLCAIQCAGAWVAPTGMASRMRIFSALKSASRFARTGGVLVGRPGPCFNTIAAATLAEHRAASRTSRTGARPMLHDDLVIRAAKFFAAAIVISFRRLVMAMQLPSSIVLDAGAEPVVVECFRVRCGIVLVSAEHIRSANHDRRCRWWERSCRQPEMRISDAVGPTVPGSAPRAAADCSPSGALLPSCRTPDDRHAERGLDRR